MPPKGEGATPASEYLEQSVESLIVYLELALRRLYDYVETYGSLEARDEEIIARAALAVLEVKLLTARNRTLN